MDDNGQWKPVEGADKYGTEKGVGNTVQFNPVRTTALKLEVVLPDKHAAGLYEWEVK